MDVVALSVKKKLDYNFFFRQHIHAKAKAEAMVKQ